MKIALVYPNYWPYVRRGVERMIHDLAFYMGGRGHTVNIITSKPGRGRVVYEGNVTTIYQGQITHPVATAYRPLFRYYTFNLTCLRELLRGNYDIAHIWAYPYGLALRLARRLRGTPFLFHIIVNPPHWPSKFDAWVFKRVFYGADEVAVLTKRDQDQVLREWERQSVILPPPVDMEQFQPTSTKDLSRPRILFASDIADTRKGAILLLRAWNEIHQRCPQAILTLSGPTGIAGEAWSFNALRLLPQTVTDPEAADAIEYVGLGDIDSVPRLYAEAAVTVMPSIQEPFGLVVVESLASGTPVVCSSHGGPGEIVSDERIGTTVDVSEIDDVVGEKRVPELVDAVLRTIELARDPKTASLCRNHAAQWGLDRVGDHAERIYQNLANNRTRKSGSEIEREKVRVK
jgi:glycosyltransferase involved in cell wall biosynthesis